MNELDVVLEPKPVNSVQLSLSLDTIAVHFDPLFNLGVLKQDRQCLYNVTLRYVHETTVTWKSNKYYICTYVYVWVCLRACSFNYPACNTPPYCRLWSLWLHHIFRYYHINGTVFEKSY